MREKQYKMAVRFLDELLKGEGDFIANLANSSAVLFSKIENLNWAGFYLYDGKELVLGPFQGKPACVRIKLGEGVCGNAASDRETYVVEDVHKFPGHIACDVASNSEIVVPMVKDGKLIGVLDIDSFEYDNFDEVSKKYLEEVVAIILKRSDI